MITYLISPLFVEMSQNNTMKRLLVYSLCVYLSVFTSILPAHHIYYYDRYEIHFAKQWIRACIEHLKYVLKMEFLFCCRSYGDECCASSFLYTQQDKPYYHIWGGDGGRKKQRSTQTQTERASGNRTGKKMKRNKPFFWLLLFRCAFRLNSNKIK